jgi:hypothetical protein
MHFYGFEGRLFHGRLPEHFEHKLVAMESYLDAARVGSDVELVLDVLPKRVLIVNCLCSLVILVDLEGRDVW